MSSSYLLGPCPDDLRDLPLDITNGLLTLLLLRHQQLVLLQKRGRQWIRSEGIHLEVEVEEEEQH